ncbi:DUF366 family protein [Carboxydothermus pertinax]|uniref:DUF366 domain-containing protein n=1 Tax=Carboxydothermus pertinax TaxID=870242 RepID=A0A1L8CUC8_9THEO|nr:DUF366 family protein [Carboxydothermus pertinax]GAV22520.1 hypothetical protein cpu_10300 [Carboxydothermus pertinax]
MFTRFIDQKIDYDGSQLRPHFIYENFGLIGDAIIAFRGKASVLDHLVDLEDKKKEAFIYSEDMLHFIVEHFDLDLEKAVLRQRLLIAIIKETLEVFIDKPIVRMGDDLFIDDRKLSVSIATKSLVSTLIHTGINVKSDNAPVAAIGLKDLGLENRVEYLGRFIVQRYGMEMESINLAKAKVRGVF